MANFFYSVGDSSKVKETGQIVKTQTENNISEENFSRVLSVRVQKPIKKNISVMKNLGMNCRYRTVLPI
jgi:hypothetical protein